MQKKKKFMLKYIFIDLFFQCSQSDYIEYKTEQTIIGSQSDKFKTFNSTIFNNKFSFLKKKKLIKRNSTMSRISFNFN